MSGGALRSAAVAVLLCMAASASACLGGAPRDHFYRLEAPSPAQRFETPVLVGTLEVDPLHADPLVRGRPILRSLGPDSVEVVAHRYHLWVDSPTVSIQRALVADLRARGVAERVVTPEMRAGEDWVVVGRVTHLEHYKQVAGPGVLVELDLGLTDARNGRLLWRETYRDERTVIGGVDEAARAMGQALGRIFERFAGDLAEVGAGT